MFGVSAVVRPMIPLAAGQGADDRPGPAPGGGPEITLEERREGRGAARGDVGADDGEAGGRRVGVACSADEIRQGLIAQVELMVADGDSVVPQVVVEIVIGFAAPGVKIQRALENIPGVNEDLVLLVGGVRCPARIGADLIEDGAAARDAAETAGAAGAPGANGDAGGRLDARVVVVGMDQAQLPHFGAGGQDDLPAPTVAIQHRPRPKSDRALEKLPT